MRRSGFERLPIRVFDMMVVEPIIFGLSLSAPQMLMPNDGIAFLSLLIWRKFYKIADCHALLDVENILVRIAGVRIGFLFLGVAMQVEDINLIKSLHEILPHAAKGRIIQVAMIGDEGQHALSGLVNAPLRPAEKFYVIILQPFGIPFTERLAIAEIIITNEL